MSRHARKVPIPRTLVSIVGLAAVVTAGLGAVAVGQAQQSADATTATSTASTETVSADPLQVEAARRARVVRASRDFTRTSLRTGDSNRQQAAARSAQQRARSLRRLAAAAEQRSAEIKEARERRRRLQRQRERERERERRREAARQRRIERLSSWVVPVSNYRISATFGAGGSLWSSDHTGLDFAAAEGSPVGSAASGTVTFTGWDGAYGNKVVVTHSDGTETWYCHLSSITVGSGQSVGAGTTIGAVGSTGNSTGPHLHLEVRPGGGDPTDPYSFLQSKGAF